MTRDSNFFVTQELRELGMAQKIQLTPVFIFVSFHYGAGILEIGKDFQEKFSGVKQTFSV